MAVRFGTILHQFFLPSIVNPPFDDKIDCWLLAVSHWLTFGDPSLLRLGNSNKFDCSRLNRSVSWLTQNREFKEVREVKEVSDGTSSESVYSDLGCCRKAVKEKISTKGQACLKPKVDIFYFNNS